MNLLPTNSIGNVLGHTFRKNKENTSDVWDIPWWYTTQKRYITIIDLFIIILRVPKSFDGFLQVFL